MTAETEQLRAWRTRIFWSVWITYASFYLCRVNMSVAIPGIMKEFGISKTSIGIVLSALFTTYAAGQFISGQLGDKYGARKLITIGILASAALNIAFGFTNGLLGSMILVWALNGFFQSMGWGPTVKTVANWFPPKTRTKRAGLLGASYQFGNAASWALAGFVVGLLGWRWAFFIPAIICAATGIHWAIRGRDSPEDVGLPATEEQNQAANSNAHPGFKHTIKYVLTKKRIWAAALALCGLNVVRYGFMDWAPTYLFEVQKAAISVAAYKALIIPLTGILGALFAAYVSDKFFEGRKAPIAAAMLFCLAALVLVFTHLPAQSSILGIVVIALIGFFTYGPHVMIVTAMPMDFGTKKAAASAAGFIDGWGYIGAALTGVGTGWLVDTFSWNAAFYFWTLGAVGAALIMTVLWAYKVGAVGEYR